MARGSSLPKSTRRLWRLHPTFTTYPGPWISNQPSLSSNWWPPTARRPQRIGRLRSFHTDCYYCSLKTSATRRASGRKHSLAACALVQVNALRRASTQPPAMAPLPLLAQHWLTTNGDATEACCSRLLALDAPRGCLPMPLRLRQSNRHANCK